jgi:hypothetical protein
MLVRLENIPGGISATARVACSRPLQSSQSSSNYWLIGISLEEPANWWCMAPTPQDWEQYPSVPRVLSGAAKRVEDNLFASQSAQK